MADVIDIFDRYRKEFPHYLEFIDSLQEIHLLREENRTVCNKEIFALNQAEAERRLKEGRPMINLRSDLFAEQEPKNYFLKLLGIIEKDNPEATTELHNTIINDNNAYTRLVRELFTLETGHLLKLDKNAEALNLVPLFVHESLKPFFKTLAIKLKSSIEKSDWNQGLCPVCSRPADLSLLREDEGRRSLFCLQCDYEWPYKRMQCPFCGEEDQQKLSYFTINDDSSEKYRVNVCRRCRRYIKTVDTRKIDSAIDPEIENLITLHLDLQACKEDFK